MSRPERRGFKVNSLTRMTPRFGHLGIYGVLDLCGGG